MKETLEKMLLAKYRHLCNHNPPPHTHKTTHNTRTGFSTRLDVAAEGADEDEATEGAAEEAAPVPQPIVSCWCAGSTVTEKGAGREAPADAAYAEGGAGGPVMAPWDTYVREKKQNAKTQHKSSQRYKYGTTARPMQNHTYMHRAMLNQCDRSI